MAEPLILAYGRGKLPVPRYAGGRDEDIVPCDHVVNAILAVSATQPEIGHPEFCPRLRRAPRNPLSFQGDLQLHPPSLDSPPLRGRCARGRPAARSGSLTGASSIERLLSTSESAHRTGTALVSPDAALRPGLARSLRTWITRSGAPGFPAALSLALQGVRPLRIALRGRRHFCPLTRALHPDDQAAFAFDTSVFDWKTYRAGSALSMSITAPVRRDRCHP